MVEARAPIPPSRSAIYLSSRQAEALLTLFAQGLEAGLALPAIVRSGALIGVPPAAAARLTADADLGVPLSVTLRELGVLDAAGAGLLRAKEASGGVPEALGSIAARVADARRARFRLLTLLLYPIGLLFAGSLIAPLPLAFTCGPGAYFARAVPAALTVVGVPLFLFVGLPRLDPGGVVRGLALQLAARLPLSSAALLYGAVAAFTDVLGACLRAGISMRESLPLAAEAASGHPGFAEAAPTLQARLDRGETLAQIVGSIPGLPPLVLAQVSSAEVSGTLDKVLETVRREYQDKARTTWQALAIVAAVICGSLVLAWMVSHIIGGFGAAVRSFDRALDTVAPPPP